MLVIVGFIVVLALVFGGYVLAGGKFAVIIHALPFELMMIGGAAVGSFMAGNQGLVIKATLKSFKTAIKGPHWKRQDYQDLLCLLFLLCKLMKTKGMIALEAHIEKPESSPLFGRFPHIVHDHFAIAFICDTLRMMTMSLEDPHQVEDTMEKQLEKHHHEILKAAQALQTMADGLPALGIVAAVLGVIKTMSSITEPPPILGKMIGGALVGTFLGVFLAYCIVAPFAVKLNQVYEEEAQFYHIIRDVLVAHLHGNAPQISVEIGRGSVPTHMQPTFYELEEAINNLPADALNS